jgi:hypothetical protein
MDGGRGDAVFADKPILGIYVDMVFVSKVAFAVLFCPPCIGVFLRLFMGLVFTLWRDFSLFDLFVLFSTIVLYRRNISHEIIRLISLNQSLRDSSFSRRFLILPKLLGFMLFHPLAQRRADHMADEPYLLW